MKFKQNLFKLLSIISIGMTLLVAPLTSKAIHVVTIEEPPFIYLNKDSQVDGPYHEMFTTILKNMGHNDVTWEVLGYDVVLSSMKLGKYDLAIALIPINEKSCKEYSLTDPIVDYEMVAFKRLSDDTYYSVQDTIDGKLKTVTMANGQNARGIQSVIKDDKNLFLVNDSPDVLNWVLHNKADVGLTGSLTLKSYQDRGAKVTLAEGFYNKDIFSFDNVQASAIVNKNNPELLAQFNIELNRYKESGNWLNEMKEIGFSDTSINNLKSVKTNILCNW